ncbi:MAG: hypothetical protein HWE25_06910 [Alphaproteobacteria bacterium]|nr:hypothetical protein [Alphaproteobacteria bacterium]
MKPIVSILLLIVVWVAVSLAPPSTTLGLLPAAFARDEHDDVMQALRRGEIMSLARIKNIAQSRLKGVVVSQRLRRTNRGWQYFLRLRQEGGTVISAVLDAKTGDILDVSKPKKRGN